MFKNLLTKKALWVLAFAFCCLLFSSALPAGVEQAKGSEATEELSEEELEIIEMLELLENYEYLEEDMAFLEELDVVDGYSNSGDDNE